MSGFVVGPVVPATPATPEPVVKNDGWFPDIDPATVRAEAKIRDSVLPARLRKAIVGAVISVGNNLETWAAARGAEGHRTLAAVPSKEIDGTSRLVILYLRAVTASAKAEIVETYRDTDLTGQGDRKVEDLEPSVDELRRDATQAIRDIMGRTRTRIELI